MFEKLCIFLASFEISWSISASFLIFASFLHHFLFKNDSSLFLKYFLHQFFSRIAEPLLHPWIFFHTHANAHEETKRAENELSPIPSSPQPFPYSLSSSHSLSIFLFYFIKIIQRARISHSPSIVTHLNKIQKKNVNSRRDFFLNFLL